MQQKTQSWLLIVWGGGMPPLAGVISSKGDVPISAPKLDASSMEFIKSIQLSEQLYRKKYSYNIPSRSIR